MMSGMLLTAIVMFAPGQTEPAPAPRALPPVEGYRQPGEVPKPAEVALPLATSGCATCSQSIAQYPPGCGPGDCEGSFCSDTILGPPIAAWSNQAFAYYWLKPAPLPTLLTTLANGGRVQVSPANANFKQASGGNIASERWLNDAHTFGYGFSGTLLEQRGSFFTIASDGGGNPALTRPFVDALTNQVTDFFVSDPGRLSGTFAAASGARFTTGELYGLMNVKYCPTKCLNLLAGFRYMDLDEYLELYQQTSGIGQQQFTVAGVPTAGPINIVDRFRTRNQFWGFEIGARGDVTMKCVTFGVTSKIAIGNVHQTLDIAGQTTAAGAPTTQGGLLALSSNIGNTPRINRFGVLTDLSAEVGLQLTEGSRLFIAYDFIYLNDVIRPGSQIDSVINPRFVPASASFNTLSGPASPLRTGRHDDFFVHGVRIGYQIQY